jgi:multicomponent Na+:H+ antiporter subunit B
MSSLVLSTATRFLMTLLLLFSAFVLLRGHDAPGGGFIGGLVAAAAFALHLFAEDARAARRALRVEPRTLIAAGLLTAAASGVPSVLAGDPFMAGRWGRVGGVELGTPLLFDVGVYLVVLGATLTIVFSLAED